MLERGESNFDLEANEADVDLSINHAQKSKASAGLPTLGGKVSQSQVLLGSMGSFDHRGKATAEMGRFGARGSQ